MRDVPSTRSPAGRVGRAGRPEVGGSGQGEDRGREGSWARENGREGGEPGRENGETVAAERILEAAPSASPLPDTLKMTGRVG